VLLKIKNWHSNALLFSSLFSLLTDQPLKFHAWQAMQRDQRFFYKYNPLTNVFIKTNSLPMFLTNLAWREAEKVPRRTFRHCTWRCYYPAKGIGGKAFLPLVTAEVNSGGLALSACMQATRRKHMPRVHAWPLTHARAA
jgi:hypothetical protein